MGYTGIFMIDPLVLSLRKSLSLPLPGREAQYLMAPSLRPAGRESYDGTHARESGVLILLYPGPTGLSTVFIERTRWGPHGGQVSLPGGKAEEGDDDIIQTALRETREEIGISTKGIEILGLLTPLYVPHSNYRIHPVVGYIDYRPLFKPDSHEAESVIEVGLMHLFSEERRKQMIIRRPGSDIEAPYYDAGGHVVWGATAMIMSELEQVLISGISG